MVKSQAWLRNVGFQKSVSFLPTHLKETVASFSDLLSLGASKEYNVWCVSYCHIGLAKTNTKWIWVDFYIRNFLAYQVTTVETRNVLRWSSNMRILSIFFNPQKPGTRKLWFERPVFRHFFCLFRCRVAPWSSSVHLNVHPVYSRTTLLFAFRGQKPSNLHPSSAVEYYWGPCLDQALSWVQTHAIPCVTNSGECSPGIGFSRIISPIFNKHSFIYYQGK